MLGTYYTEAVSERFGFSFFLDFEEAKCLDAEGFSQKIIAILDRYGLEYKRNIAGQA